VPPPQLGLVVSMACANEAPAPQPAVDNISTTGGPAAGGTPVTILGTGFTPASTVSFGGVPASDVTYESPQTLTAVSPAGSGMADVVVRSAGGSSDTSTADQFYYGSPPTVTGLSVTQGPGAGGTVVTVHGTGFAGATVVGFGGIPGSALDVESDTELQVTTPAEQPGTVDVVVDTPAGGSTVSSADRFTFLAASTNPVGPGPVSTNPVSTNPVTINAGTSTTATFKEAPVPPSCTLEPLSDTVLLAKRKPKKRQKSNASVGTLSLTAACSQAVSVRLTGVLTELVGKKPKHGTQKTRRFDLGPVSGTLAAGVGKTLVLKLPNGAISGLKSKANESAALTLIATNANGQGRATASITSLKDVP
jgi:IPT/TIG domain